MKTTITLIAIFFCLSLSAQTYYVSNIGNDANTGLTDNAPLRTIAALLAKSPQNGSTIYLQRGSIWYESLKLDTINGVTVKAYGEGAAPLLDASDYLNNSWTQYTTGGATHVWYRAISIGTGVNQQPATWDNSIGGRNHMRKQSSPSAVNSMLGSFYYDGTNLYVSTFAGSAPTNNQISVAIRNEGMILGNNAFVEGIATRRNLYNDGSLVVHLNSTVQNCTISDGSKHNILIGSGTVSNCDLFGQGHPDDYGGAYSAIAGFFDIASAEKLVIVNCRSDYQWSVNANATVLTAHANNGGYFKTVEMYGGRYVGWGGVYGNNPVKAIMKDVSFVDCRNVVSGGTDTVISDHNSYIMTPSCSWGFIVPFEFYAVPTYLSSVNDLFIGTPNYGQGFITVRESSAGTTANLVNPRFVYNDGNSAAKAMIRFDCVGTLIVKGLTEAGGATNAFAIWGYPGMTYQLSANTYTQGRFFNINGGYQSFDTWKTATGQDQDSHVYQLPENDAVGVPSISTGGNGLLVNGGTGPVVTAANVTLPVTANTTLNTLTASGWISTPSATVGNINATSASIGSIGATNVSASSITGTNYVSAGSLHSIKTTVTIPFSTTTVLYTFPGDGVYRVYVNLGAGTVDDWAAYGEVMVNNGDSKFVPNTHVDGVVLKLTLSGNNVYIWQNGTYPVISGLNLTVSRLN